ncbi:MAG: winged helix DNA-binding domain-containing protein [Anaerolineae bacterium]|nr:winged helix DNA-binding domain-containing protein [Anaerolineae bacterium]
MNPAAIARRQLAQQHLSHNRLGAPEEVVAWLGAVQSQDYYGAKWSLGLRIAGATDALIERAFDDGRILRTHVMRPTWHFVHPEDIGWLLALTAHRVIAQLAYMSRRLELDEALHQRNNEVLARALEGGRYLTRAELGAALAGAGIAAEGQRFAYILMRAELDGVICSGPRRGKQFTYALVAERAPQARMLEREEALAELTLRYMTSHGPATERDLSWWSGLTLADVREGIALAAASLEREEVDGAEYWFASGELPAAAAEEAILLPTYDEFLVGYAGYGRRRRGGAKPAGELVFEAPFVLAGEVAGSWRRTVKRGMVNIEVAPFRPLAAEETTAVQAAAERFGAFLEMPITMQLMPGGSS